MSARMLGTAALALAATPGLAQGTGFYGLTGVRDIHGDVSSLGLTPPRCTARPTTSWLSFATAQQAIGPWLPLVPMDGRILGSTRLYA